MKLFYFFIVTMLLSFSTIVHAQSPCDAVSVEAFPLEPQSGPYNYFGVRVSLSQPYSQDITVTGYIWDGPDEHGYNENHPYTLTIVAGSLSAETPVNFYQTGPAAEGAANVTSVDPCPSSAPVSINDNRLQFQSIDAYEQYADNVLDRSILSTLSTENSNITTMSELDPNDDNDLYPDFLKQILNSDHIFEMGSFLLKVDLENHRVLAINSRTSGAYQTLVNNQLTASGLIELDDTVCNGIEILIGIENGTLTTSNYQSAIETSDTYLTYTDNKLLPQFVGSPETSNLKVGIGGEYILPASMFPCGDAPSPSSCRHARRHTDQDNGPNGHVWDTKTGGDCADNTISYYLQPDVTYQKDVIYFALKAKAKSWLDYTCKAGGTYLAHLKIEGTAKFVKRCGAEQNVSAGSNLTADYWKLKWKPFESSRSLSKYDFQVVFEIQHYGSSNPYVLSRTYRIVDGY